MTSTPHSRRDLLKGAAAVAAASIGGATTARRIFAQGSTMSSRARVDAVLRQGASTDSFPAAAVCRAGSREGAGPSPHNSGRCWLCGPKNQRNSDQRQSLAGLREIETAVQSESADLPLWTPLERR